MLPKKYFIVRRQRDFVKCVFYEQNLYNYGKTYVVVSVAHVSIT
jgi:hypothetical protein